MKLLEETKAEEPVFTYSETTPVVFNDETLKMDSLTFKERFEKWFIFIQYPWSVWFIISTELCERFAFYGFKTILTLYLNEFLKFSPDSATSIVHAFIFLAYFTPLLGGFLADSILGKYWTIFSLSLLYCAGQSIISFTAIPGVTGKPPHWWGCALGLFLVAFGTGGIKPCVSSFGGDQIKENQTELLASFFALFYFSVNLGSTVSTFLIPIIRTHFGYAIAFSIPAVLLIIATCIFGAGKWLYVHVPPTGFRNNPFFQVSRVIYSALRNWRNPRYEKVRHWIDRAVADYDRRMVYDVKCCLRVIKVLFPIIIFWALFDQHSTRFVFQANHMNRKIGPFELSSDQITALNPVLVIILVIVFDRVIYRVFDAIGLKPRPLRRIGLGFLFTFFSFVAAAILDVYVVDYNNQIHVIWQFPQYLLLCIGEVLVSVTGLELAYSQSPKAMKGFMQSFYLLTVSIGNMIVVLIASSSIFPITFKYRQAGEFLLFAFLMLLAFCLFLFLAKSYKYRRVMPPEEKVPEKKGIETNELSEATMEEKQIDDDQEYH
jgi:POT family proton-dependent oligopeptide transporter